MCEFISWIEKDKKVYFLTGEQIYNSPTGEALKKWSQNIEDDKKGHGAIRFYYNLEGGKERECTDFSTPQNFPDAIVKAIKNGEFKGFEFPRGLLSAPLYADYEAKLAPLDADYKAKRAPLDADYEAKLAPLDADYKAKRAALYADYEAKRAALYADYKAKRAALYADCWELFKDPQNRAEAWK